MVPTRGAAAESILQPACPTHRLMGVIGDRWSLLVLIALHDAGPLRSADVKRAVEGISQKMLTQVLRRLETHDFVSRDVEATVPVSVTYGLTTKGRDLYGALAPVRAWAEQNLGDA